MGCSASADTSRHASANMTLSTEKNNHGASETTRRGAGPGPGVRATYDASTLTSPPCPLWTSPTGPPRTETIAFTGLRNVSHVGAGGRPKLPLPMPVAAATETSPDERLND